MPGGLASLVCHPLMRHPISSETGVGMKKGPLECGHSCFLVVVFLLFLVVSMIYVNQMIVQSFVSATGSLHSASPNFLAHVERPFVRWTGYGFCRTSSWSHSEDMIIIGKSWFPREGKRRKGANDEKCI